MHDAQLQRIALHDGRAARREAATSAATALRSRRAVAVLDDERRDVATARRLPDLSDLRLHAAGDHHGFAPPTATRAPSAGRSLVPAIGPTRAPVGPTELPPKKPCAACRAAGESSDLCPECAAPTERAGAPRQADDEIRTGGGREPDKDDPAECGTCARPQRTGSTLLDRTPDRHASWMTSSGPGRRPMEAGWWTSRTPTSNTIGCDGSGNLVVMNNGATYQYGVTACTIRHEQVHANDWLARYGNNICAGRARGDLPHYDPPGAEAYDTFLEQSECRAWTVGEACRKQKLAACTTDACKTYVQGHVDFAGEMVKKYCGSGLSALAKAAIGVLGGAAVGAGIGAIFGGGVGAVVGAGVGALVGGLGSLLF